MKKYFIYIIIAILLLSGAFACPIYNIIGIPCPACGITRACKLALKGQIFDAFIMHPLFWLPPLFIFTPFQKKWVIITGVGVFIAVYIIRLLLMFPDMSPMNYNYNSILGVFLK